MLQTKGDQGMITGTRLKWNHVTYHTASQQMQTLERKAILAFEGSSNVTSTSGYHPVIVASILRRRPRTPASGKNISLGCAYTIFFHTGRR